MTSRIFPKALWNVKVKRYPLKLTAPKLQGVTLAVHFWILQKEGDPEMWGILDSILSSPANLAEQICEVYTRREFFKN
jgi:hypothetical protein